MNEQLVEAVRDAACRLVNHLIEGDERTRNAMSDYISHMMNKLPWVNMDNIIVEDTPEYDLYYALTTEFHTKVLAEATLALVRLY